MIKYVGFTYYPPIETKADGSLRPVREFKTRDGLAFVEVQNQLPFPDFVYSGMYQNVPRKAPAGYPSRQPQRDSVEFRWLDHTDLLVQTIRPPITDDFIKDDAKKTIPRSYSWLDCTLNSEFQSHLFRGCSRDSILIAESLLDRVPLPHRKRQFLQNGVAGSWYKETQPRCTSGYVAFLPRTDQLPAVLNIFGMGGNDTLRTAHLLRVRCPGLLGSLVTSPRPRLLIFEMKPPEGFEDDAPTLPGLLNSRYEGWIFELVVDTK